MIGIKILQMNFQQEARRISKQIRNYLIICPDVLLLCLNDRLVTTSSCKRELPNTNVRLMLICIHYAQG